MCAGANRHRPSFKRSAAPVEFVPVIVTEDSTIPSEKRKPLLTAPYE